MAIESSGHALVIREQQLRASIARWGGLASRPRVCCPDRQPTFDPADDRLKTTGLSSREVFCRCNHSSRHTDPSGISELQVRSERASHWRGFDRAGVEVMSVVWRHPRPTLKETYYSILADCGVRQSPRIGSSGSLSLIPSRKSPKPSVSTQASTPWLFQHLIPISWTNVLQGLQFTPERLHDNPACRSYKNGMACRSFPNAHMLTTSAGPVTINRRGPEGWLPRLNLSSLLTRVHLLRVRIVARDIDAYPVVRAMTNSTTPLLGAPSQHAPERLYSFDRALDNGTSRGRIRAYWLGSVVCMGAFLFGYDSGM